MPQPRFPRLQAFLPALLLALPLPGAALAAGQARAPAPRVALEVVDRDDGQLLPQYHHRGQAWLPGEPGHRYAVRLRNTTGERVLVVLSVDGVNVVSGQTAAPSQAGYVLDPWETTEIAGWRKSLDDIAQFVFTDLPDSYAARTGRPDNVGVIGIAVFREYQPPRLAYAPPIATQAQERRPAAAKAAAADRAMAESSQRLGTGHGQREWAPVGRTEFRRASSRPQQVSQLRYDDVASLAAMGILRPPYRPYVQEGPRAFPQGFVPDPPYRY